MNAEVLQTISIVAFALAGLFLLVSIVLFFRLDIREIANDLTGKTAERQIKELREQNHQMVNNKNGRIVYEAERKKFTAKLESGKKRETIRLQSLQENEVEETAELQQNLQAKETTILTDEEGTTMLTDEEGTTVLDDKEGTTILTDEEGTTVLDDKEGTTVLENTATKIIRNGYRLLLDEMIIHTGEEI